jgi:molecular chaperone DnaJ
MRGKGIPYLNRGGSGDQLVRVLAWTPQKLTKEQEKILEDLRDELAGKVPPPGSHVFD